MKVFKLLAVSVALTTSGLAMADNQVVRSGNVFEANQLIPTGVRAEVGTTGYGGAVLWTANPYVGLALGYNGGDISWSDDLSINGTKYDAEMDNNVAYLNAEIRPWGASDNLWAQGLYMAAGVGYLDTKYDLDKRNKNAQGSIEVNNVAYTGLGGVRGTQKYENDFAPYVGLGFAPKINKNWGVFGEVGAYYTGNPSVNLENYGTLTNSGGGAPIGQSVAAEAEKIRNDDKYEWLPVGKVGVSFHF